MRHERLGTAAALLAAACSSGPGPSVVHEGTWGGNDAGLLLSATNAHVHVGCTAGDFAAPIPVQGDGALRAEGRYSHKSELYPVDLGVDHPAVFSGRLDGERITFTVTVTDGGTVYGPAEVRLGVDPTMQDCPICRFPKAERKARSRRASATLSLGL